MRRIAPHNANRGAGRWGFTLVELMVVIVIIAIASIIGVSAWMRMVAESEQRSARSRLEALATAIKEYEAERRDFPPMRLSYVDNESNLLAPPPWSPQLDLSNARPYRQGGNVEQSIEALVYCLRYRSAAGSALDRLSSKIVVNRDNDYIVEGGQQRPLDEVLDPWGNPIQYLRPRAYAGQDPNDPLSRERLNNQVILVSMGPDDRPGLAGVNDDDPGNSTDMDTWTDAGVPGGGFDPVPVPALGTTHPDPRELGMGDDIKMVVGSIR